jgi:hypothetical protein
VGTATSTAVVAGVVATGTGATHVVAAGGYIPGTTVTITNAFSYVGVATGLSWHVLLPDGWSYASSAGAPGDTSPAAGATSLLDWTWTTVPASPVTFTYTLNVPPTATGNQALVALATLTQNGVGLVLLVQPDPLVVIQFTNHSADTDRNFRISLAELTRVIELYNTRLGTARTGRYRVQAGTEDGFAADAVSTSNQTFSHYHSADSNRDGQISVIELTRVIELYNTRVAAVRTGQYHVSPTPSEDGFAPGP